jgi:hypothetical protein
LEEEDKDVEVGGWRFIWRMRGMTIEWVCVDHNTQDSRFWAGKKYEKACRIESI